MIGLAVIACEDRDVLAIAQTFNSERCMIVTCGTRCDGRNERHRILGRCGHCRIWNCAGLFGIERLDHCGPMQMLRTFPTLPSRSRANYAASAMPSNSDDDPGPSDEQSPSERTQRTAKRSGPVPNHAQKCVRILRIVKALLRRDMKRHGLSLRRASAEGRISIGTLRSFVNGRRIEDPKKQPKRGVHHGTILHLRGMPWIGPLTAKPLDRLLAATPRQVGPSRR